MQLNDHSGLRSSDIIDIPLNGQTYQAVTDPPGDVILSVTQVASGPDIELMAKAMKDDGSLTAEQMAQASKAGMSSTQRMLRFLDQVLTPESAERWRHYFAAFPPHAADATEDEITLWRSRRADHDRHRISLKQCTAVVRDLIKVYSGGDPTNASSSSSNGGGGTGVTSTAGAPPEG